MPAELPYQKLATSQGVLVDLGSLRAFVERYGASLFFNEEVFAQSRGMAPAGLEALKRQIYRDVTVKHADQMRLLELIITHEVIVIDAVAFDRESKAPFFESAKIATILEQPFFLKCHIPDEIRGDVGRELRNKGKAIGQLLALGGGYDKAAHDFLFETISEDFADSTDSIFRAFYYLTIARKSGLPLVISVTKQAFLEEIYAKSLYGLAGLHERLSATALKKLESWNTWSVPLPPVQELILNLCWKEKISPWVAAVQIRNSREAKAYRSVIQDLTVLSQGTAFDRITASKKIVALESLLTEWASTPGSSIQRPVRKLNLQKVPGIGWVAEAFGQFESVNIPDWTLSPIDPAMVFMSDWFRPANSDLILSPEKP